VASTYTTNFLQVLYEIRALHWNWRKTIFYYCQHNISSKIFFPWRQLFLRLNSKENTKTWWNFHGCVHASISKATHPRYQFHSTWPCLLTLVSLLSSIDAPIHLLSSTLHICHHQTLLKSWAQAMIHNLSLTSCLMVSVECQKHLLDPMLPQQCRQMKPLNPNSLMSKCKTLLDLI
jgi:hypothetical protein